MGFSELRASQCKGSTFRPVGSKYESNLKSVMDDLVNNAPKTGYNTSSRGENAEEVYGLLQCRGDASPQDCSDCSQEARITIQQLCVNATGGQVWLEMCFLRYDNFRFFSQLDTHVINLILNPQIVQDNPGGFQNEEMDLLRLLIGKSSDPASNGFAAGSVTLSSDRQRIFGLVECWRSLSMEQCKSCFALVLVILDTITVNEGAEAFLGSCRIRIETYPFSSIFAGSASAHQKKSSTNVKIVCGVLGGGLLAFAIGLFIMRKKIRSAILQRPDLLREMEDRGSREWVSAPLFSFQMMLGNRSRDGFSGSLLCPQMMFSLDTLIEATGQFQEDNKLGEGGFGSVYKGITSHGTAIAVKKLSLRSTQGTTEFLNEVKVLAKIQHRNLVQLLGCCVDGPERLLVYEYLPNKSLDTFLFNPEGRKVLDWKKRYNIIIGIARGLLYLHQDSQMHIIHRDVKANNILLDDKLNPKIADFGLARLFPDDETHVHTRVAGTFGYMAPEYAMLGQLSAKADVYSFGVVLLEIVSGRRNTDICLPKEIQSLVKLGWILCDGENLLNMIDSTIIHSLPQEEALRCIEVGLLCVQDDAANRPAMLDVVVMLSTNLVAIPNPAIPAFVSRRFGGFSATKDEAVTTSSAPSQIELSSSTMSGCDASSIKGLEPR